MTYCALADNPNLKDFREIGSFPHIFLTGRGSIHAETEADGSFVVLAIPGSGLLSARAEIGDFLDAKPKEIKGEPLKAVPPFMLDREHAFVPIQIISNDPKTLFYEIALDPGRSLKGVIVGPDGQPLSGTHVVGLRSRARRDDASSAERAGLKGADFIVTALAPRRIAA